MAVSSPYSLQTPEKLSQTLATRVRALRLAQGWRQVTLAERAGVSLAAVRRFETSSQISLQGLLKLVFALNRLDDFDDVLTSPEPKTMAELEAQHALPKRQRGRK